MAGKYPIIIDGAPLGALEVKKNGVRTQFHARCRMVDGLLRLSVYGQGREGYLGVMVPESGELTLTRSLSPLDMRAFPETIERVGRAGEGRATVCAFSADASPAPQPPQDSSPVPQPPQDASPAPQPPQDASPAPQPPQDSWPAPQPPQDSSPAPQPPQDSSPAPQPPQDASPAPQPPQDASPAPQPPAGPCPCAPEPPCVPSRPCELFWYASPDGALVSFDGERSYVALPPGDRRIPSGISGEHRTIEGREYLVFISKNGRITL